MPRGAREVIAGLLKKGFVRRENDHTFLHYFANGKKTPIFTKISHGEKEVGDPLLNIMARQLRISRRELLDLIDCPLSEENYAKGLRTAGHID